MTYLFNNKPEQKIARLSALLDKKALPQADFQDFTIDEEIFKILSTPADKRSPEDRQKLMDYNKKQLDRQKLENEIKRVEEELAKDSNNEELRKYLKWLKGLKGEYFEEEKAKKEKLWNDAVELTKKLAEEKITADENKQLMEIQENWKGADSNIQKLLSDWLSPTQTAENKKTLLYLLLQQYRERKVIMSNNLTPENEKRLPQLNDLISELQNAISKIGGKVPYGSTKCAEMVQNFRKKLQANQKEGKDLSNGLNTLEQEALKNTKFKANYARNIAVVAYKDNENKIQYKMAVSLPAAVDASAKHAEEILMEELKRLNIPLNNVIEWYSELQPCDKPEHTCMNKIKMGSPNAIVTYTFDYPKGVANHKDFVNTQFKE